MTTETKSPKISLEQLKTDDILKYILVLRLKYGIENENKNFFLNGGCYIFAKILQVRFGGVIYSNGNHCILRKGAFYYDIEGVREHKTAVESDYTTIDELEARRYANYENFIF